MRFILALLLLLGSEMALADDVKDNYIYSRDDGGKVVIRPKALNGTYSDQMTIDPSTEDVTITGNGLKTGKVTAPSGDLTLDSQNQVIFSKEAVFNDDVGIGVSPEGALSFSAAESSTIPKIRFQNTHSVDGDAAISTYDDALGTLLYIGSNSYLHATGALLRYNTSEESSGIQFDRTGSVILNTGGTGENPQNRMTINSSGNVGIGTSSPGITSYGAGRPVLTIKGATGAENYGILELYTSQSDAGGDLYGAIDFGSGTNRNAMIRANREANDDDAYISFWTRPTGGTITQRMTIDSSGNVGIGTSSPQASRKLTIQSDGTNSGLVVRNTSSAIVGQFVPENVTTSTDLGIYATNEMRFYTNSDKAMTIDSSGRVGIGGAPQRYLDLRQSFANSFIRITRTDNATAYGALEFAGSDNVVDWDIGTNLATSGEFSIRKAASPVFTIDSSGNVDIPGSLTFKNGSGTESVLTNHYSSATQATITEDGTVFNVTSVNVTVGTWLISAGMHFSASTGNVGRFQFGVSLANNTLPASSIPNTSTGEMTIYQYACSGTISASNLAGSISPYIVTISTNDTLYLNGSLITSVSNATAYGWISAIRIN